MQNELIFIVLKIQAPFSHKPKQPRRMCIFKAKFIINFHKLKSELSYFKEFWLLHIRIFNASLKDVFYVKENLKLCQLNQFQLLSSGLYWLRFGTFQRISVISDVFKMERKSSFWRPSDFCNSKIRQEFLRIITARAIIRTYFCIKIRKLYVNL